MPAKLVFVTGSRAGTSVELGPGTTTLGRAADRTIQLSPDEILVSSDHASIEARDGCYLLRDGGSRNGTWVNQRRVTEHALQNGDLIAFGRQGPAAQFVVAAPGVVANTLSADDLAGLRAAVARARSSGPDTVGFSRGLSSTREFVAMTYQRSKRAHRWLVGGAAVAVVGVSGLFWWQNRSRSELESSVLQLSSALASERSSRSALESNLSAVRAGYDSLLAQVDASRQELSRGARLDAGDVARRLSGGVALVVFSYGFAEREGGGRLLRYQVDPSGQPRTVVLPNGRRAPAFGFDGSGPPVALEGSATGFLIDSTGWIVTNKHVAEPWNYRDDIAFLKADPGLVPRFIALRAYFPPGNQVFDLTVVKASADRTIDVALLSTGGRRVDAPVIPLADARTTPSPGDPVVLIGYPTGVHNLLFRVADSVRSAILKAVGQEPVDLAAELGRRRLIQPLAISGAVSDTTAVEIIHTAATTGGGSGGPLIGPTGAAIGIHYAAVKSPIEGDPFQTQRAIRASYVQMVLPASPKEALPP
jgi:serine protease Do